MKTKTPSGSIVIAQCTIAAGQSLSSPADCSAGIPVAIITPQTWDYAGGLTLQASPDGTNFYDVLLPSGEELHAAMIPNVCCVLPNTMLQWAVSLKIRSGRREQLAVTQSANRIFSVIVQIP